MTTVAVMGFMAYFCLDSPSPFRAKDPVINLTAMLEITHRVSRRIQ